MEIQARRGCFFGVVALFANQRKDRSAASAWVGHKNGIGHLRRIAIHTLDSGCGPQAKVLAEK